MKRMKKCCEVIKAKTLMVLLTKIGCLPLREMKLSRQEVQIELNKVLLCHNEKELMSLMDDSEKEMFTYLMELWHDNIWTDEVAGVDQRF